MKGKVLYPDGTIQEEDLPDPVVVVPQFASRYNLRRWMLQNNVSWKAFLAESNDEEAFLLEEEEMYTKERIESILNRLSTKTKKDVETIWLEIARVL